MRKTNNKTTGKAKRLIMAAALFILSVSQAWAYDFSATAPSGHTLYFYISSSNTVNVVWPNSNATDIANIYDGYTEPTGNLVIPSTVTYNGTTYTVTSMGTAFANCEGLTSVTIPNTVTYIALNAFRNCTGLTSVTLSTSLNYLGERVFQGCTNLSSVNIPNNVDTIRNYAFYGCSGLTSVTIGNSVTSIGNYAFRNCTGLTSVTIPNSVTSIGEGAFYDCSGLTSVTIPNSVTSIGYAAFYNCSGLTSVTIPNSVTSIREFAFRGCSGLTSVTIPNSVTSIGSSAFWGCSGLTSVTIPNSVTSIGSSAFSYCSGLTTLNFNAINCGDFSSSYPFYNCPISTINIGDSVQRIPAYFAYYLDSISTITIPNSVTSIGSSAFWGCSGLTSVTIPNSVTSIGQNAFSGCSGLTSVTIGNSVTSIGNSAFYNCSGLTSVTIPNSVTSIGEYAFGNCSSIGRIDLKSATPPTIDGSSFQNVNSAIPVYIPCGSLSNYSSSNWGTRFPNLQESQLFSLNVAVNDSTMGMALILSNTCANTAIQAYPYDGYNFVGWSDGSTMNPRVVTLTQDTVFTAIFEANVQRYTITVMSANNNMGTVSGGGTYEEGTQATITATPAENHHFVSWNDGNTDNPRTITVTGDAVYIANFAEDVSIDAANELDALTFYPNPTSGTITFSSTDIRKVEVMDAMGRMVAEYIDSYVIDLSKLSKGHYTMRITTDNGVTIRKVIRN